MINGEWTLKRAAAMAKRLTESGPSDPDERVKRAYGVVLGRDPDADELRAASAFLDRQRRLAEMRLRPANASGGGDPAILAFEDFCHVLLNSNDFLYID
jgi:hypothetical protein